MSRIWKLADDQKMPLRSVAFGGVQSNKSITQEVKIGFISVLQKHIYVARCKWNPFMWPGVNGISTYYPDNLSGYRSHFNTRCKRGLSQIV